ncbi:MAG: aminotransferase class V-fold PLP-dependent enzyme, partial [Myxococcota bacterium]
HQGVPASTVPRRLLAAEGSRVRLVAVSGASNVTGVLTPIHEIARMAHHAGARILVDAAQLAPHRPIDLHPRDREADASLDFVALSGHKLYAPGSRGVLIGAFAPFERRRCIGDVGGGMAEYVSTEDFQVKDEITAREEAGTPNIPGTIALGMIARLLAELPMAQVARAEEPLTAYALERLRSVPGARVFGPEDPALRVGVFSFAIDGLPYGLVAAYLDDFHAIAVRDGCFCAHPYVKALLGIGAADERRYLEELARGDRRNVPGMVRASLGLYSTRDDVDALTAALAELVRERDRVGRLYRQEMDGAFVLAGPPRHTVSGEALFSLDAALTLVRG